MNSCENNSFDFDDEDTADTADMAVIQGLNDFYQEYAHAILKRDKVTISHANNPRTLLIALRKAAKKGDEEAEALLPTFYSDVVQRGRVVC